MPRRLLVTGASGFVGSAVVRAFLDAGYRVRAFLRGSSPRENLEGLEVEIAVGDLEDSASFAPALAGCEGLVHVAADYRLFVPRPAPLYRANVDGTRALMRAALAAGIERVVHTSSVAVLGHRRDGAAADEETIGTLDEMTGHYKRSKFLAEEAVRELVGEGLPAVIVNPSAPVGPRDVKPTPTGRMVLDAASGRMFAYLETALNVVHVDDVGRGHVLAYERGRVGRRYVLGGEDLALAELFASVTGLVGRKPPRLRLAPGTLLPYAAVAEMWARATGGVPRVTRDELVMARRPMRFSSARAERELGYAHRPAAAALADAVGWFVEKGRVRLPAGGAPLLAPRRAASPRR